MAEIEPELNDGYYLDEERNGRRISVVPLLAGTARLLVGPAGSGVADDAY